VDGEQTSACQRNRIDSPGHLPLPTSESVA
jgi:hypothetical protein